MKKTILFFVLLVLLMFTACTQGVTDDIRTEDTTKAPEGTALSETAVTTTESDETRKAVSETTSLPSSEALTPEEEYFAGERNMDYMSEELKIAAGVVGETDFFEPGAPIPVWVWSDASLDGQEIKVTFIGTDGKNVVQTATLRSDAETRFCFSSSQNGVGTLTFGVAGKRFSFNIGILPKNEKASDEFYYGVQPYIARVMTWGGGSYVSGYDKAGSIKAILDTAEWLGINLIREDGIPWATIQKSADAPCDFSAQDDLLSYISSRGITLDWIVSSTPEWAVAEKYRQSPEAAWQKCPDLAAWRNYITAVAGHYASADNLIFEIHNEPDWSFFTGTPEEYFEILDVAGKAIHSVNPRAYVFAGGLAAGSSDNQYYKDPAKYFTAYKPMLDNGVIDSYAYHIHSGMNTYFTKMSELDRMISAAGLPGGAVNSESGLGSPDAGALMVKALYTRAHGDRGFVQFSFRKTPTPSGDVDKFAIFDTALCPTESAIAYGAMIGFLGQSHYEGSAASGAGKNTDIYTAKDGKTIVVYYNNGTGSTKVTLPDHGCTLYNIYGNPRTMSADRTLKLTDSPVYAVFDTKLDISAFAE